MNDRFRKARHLARTAKEKLWKAYTDDRNIVGAGFGRRTANDQATDEPAVVVFVMRKVQSKFLPPSRRLPRRMYVGGDCVEVDIVESGPFYPLAFTAGERPAPSGISIGNANESSAGTLGCVVNDNTDGTTCVLSNNHVLARVNNAALGERIVQQGIFDGGSSPADDIGTLKRFVVVNSTGNTVDGAIAQITDPADIVNQMKDNLMPIPSPQHRAIGLLFAGSCSRTIMNPIRDVMAQLNISFPAGAGTIGVDEIGLNVEKVGRTTEYTTSTIKEIDVTVTIPGYSVGDAEFDNQFTTGWMSDRGDSGSVVCAGGEGGDENNCCPSATAAREALGIDVGLDAAVEKEFRQKHLSQTKIGQYGIEMYFRNEDRITDRVREAKLNQSDRALSKHLYGKYADEVRWALLNPHQSDLRLNKEHFQEAESVLGRAKPYMSKDEIAAADQLLRLARKAEGKNVREILDLLNDTNLFEDVVKIVSKVHSLRQPERPCSGEGGGPDGPTDPQRPPGQKGNGCD